jgi:hypothetical protein
LFDGEKEKERAKLLWRIEGEYDSQSIELRRYTMLTVLPQTYINFTRAVVAAVDILDSSQSVMVFCLGAPVKHIS